uniref:NADH-ubiquinone oxidoreductase chain 5 n=1 Tax=Phascolosoma esculenta TaxID=419950 RepID=C3PUJ0_9ANNE|nr:NADH dehydrogenase subunit 5 [Phascolosoma esculenta]ABQ52606.1 NADH dehydrogenase subunit 5 [Phascolosoma esculenta]
MFRYSTHFSIILFLSSVLMMTVALILYSKNTTLLLFWPFFNPFCSSLNFNILLDPVGTLFSAAVLFISSSVILFSSFYMAEDIFLKRFILMVILFILSMNFLIFIPHMMALLLGWDGLGLVSFVLVIYYQNPKSLAGGMLTALTNRIGDVMILLSISFMINCGDWLIINQPISIFSGLIIILVLIAAMTKSAQLPFSSWLPAAMAAPTPVSALVHSSTLVTAGVFLLIRFSPFLLMSQYFTTCLLICSVATLTMAGMAAMAESDLKKIIALSTLSQLGVMMMSIALGLVNLAFFHLLTHAMFKALLFMGAGTCLHLFSHTQDLRSFGNLAPQLPFVTTAILISNLALSGFPFMAGFYSKDLILEHMLMSSPSFFLIFMALGATLLTAAYSMRLSTTALWSPMLTSPHHTTTENFPSVIFPLLALSTFAVTGGALFNWLLMPAPTQPLITSMIKLIPLLVTIWGAFVTWAFNTLLSSIKNTLLQLPLMINWLTSMWFFTPVSTQPPTYIFLSFTKKVTANLDQGWLELLGPQGLPKLTMNWLKVVQPWTKNIPPLLVLLSVFFFLPLFFIFS